MLNIVLHLCTVELMVAQWSLLCLHWQLPHLLPALFEMNDKWWVTMIKRLPVWALGLSTMQSPGETDCCAARLHLPARLRSGLQLRLRPPPPLVCVCALTSCTLCSCSNRQPQISASKRPSDKWCSSVCFAVSTHSTVYQTHLLLMLMSKTKMVWCTTLSICQ